MRGLGAYSNNSCWWWLKDLRTKGDNAWCIDHAGTISRCINYVDDYDIGVRPIIKIFEE
ncbi:MAG: hypothetical protein K6G26_13555 [Lachnospiraceae bacterium]|nr:hypothetical protein [Lachnospiraceae bacterium]